MEGRRQRTLAKFPSRTHSPIRADKHAVASMASDLKTHPDIDNPALNGLAMIGMMYVTDGDKAAVQRWIERFR
jgi:hypothetical protein